MAEDEATLRALAEQSGPPPDAKRLSESDEDDAWATVDPQVDAETMARQLMTQGLPPDAVQKLMVTKIRPDLAPLLTQPTQDAEMADQLVRIAQYPFRLSLLEDFIDPEEMTRHAERLDRRFQKRMTAAQESLAQPDSGGYGQMARMASSPEGLA